jgi:hypothetical protein
MSDIRRIESTLTSLMLGLLQHHSILNDLSYRIENPELPSLASYDEMRKSLDQAKEYIEKAINTLYPDIGAE